MPRAADLLTSRLGEGRLPHMRWKTFIEGWQFIVLVFAGVLLAALHAPWLNAVLLPLLVFVVAFFRDPDRTCPGGDHEAVSAADGRVTDVGLLPNPLDPSHGDMLCIGVFLNVFDVHVNRAPLEGRITSSIEERGTYLDARHPEATRRNARRTWVFESQHGTFIVRQITGAVARRIVAWGKPGEAIPRGGRFGMIRFGSRTEVYLPASFQPLVQPGDRVLGAKSLIARAQPAQPTKTTPA